MVERLATDWSSFSEYKCHPKQYLPLLKANYARSASINSIFQNNTGFDANESMLRIVPPVDVTVSSMATRH